MKMDLESLRRDFPILSERIHGENLIYLDNAATTQKPRAVIEAMNHYYFHENANVHRGVHLLAERATHAYEAARKKVQHFIHAAAPEDCVFVRGTTEAINLVANAYLKPRLKPEDEILVTALEHHSNLVPWQLVAAKTGARLRVIPVDERGQLSWSEIEKAFNPKTRFLSVGHISNALGTINPIKKMIDYAHDLGIKVLIDGAQSVGHYPIDVQKLGCDFFAFSAHKMYGPTGIGLLYSPQSILNEMEPYQGGGEMITEVYFDHAIYQQAPYRFEAGTPNIAGAVGLGAAIDYLSELDRRALLEHELSCLVRATAGINALPRYRILGTAEEKSGIISIIHDKIHPHDLATVLDSMGIAVRAGHHCAMPLMDSLGVPATTRLSFSFYNTHAEVDRVLNALERAEEILI